MDKYRMINKIAREGHSFPHYDTCNTCISDFDDVCEWERNRIMKEIKKMIRKINLEDAMTDNFQEFKHFLLAQVDIVASSESTVLTGVKS